MKTSSEKRLTTAKRVAGLEAKFSGNGSAESIYNRVPVV